MRSPKGKSSGNGDGRQSVRKRKFDAISSDSIPASSSRKGSSRDRSPRVSLSSQNGNDDHLEDGEIGVAEPPRKKTRTSSRSKDKDKKDRDSPKKKRRRRSSTRNRGSSEDVTAKSAAESAPKVMVSMENNTMSQALSALLDETMLSVRFQDIGA